MAGIDRRWLRASLEPPRGELSYRSANKVMAVDVATRTSFSVGKPKTLLEGSFLPARPIFQNYDVSPDGQRFLMIKTAEPEQTGATQVNIVLNWTEELKRLVPTGK